MDAFAFACTSNLLHWRWLTRKRVFMVLISLSSRHLEVMERNWRKDACTFQLTTCFIESSNRLTINWPQWFLLWQSTLKSSDRFTPQTLVLVFTWNTESMNRWRTYYYSLWRFRHPGRWGRRPHRLAQLPTWLPQQSGLLVVHSLRLRQYFAGYHRVRHRG